MFQEILKKVHDRNAELVAVSKTRSATEIMEVYEMGQRIFGENRALELRDRHPALPKDIEWHMIGHLQRNKVKYIAPFVALIHSIDSQRLLKEIDKQAARHGRVIPVLLQFHIARESTKFGFSRDEAEEMLTGDQVEKLEHVDIQGVMGMATLTDDREQIRREFQELRAIFEDLKQRYFQERESFRHISMGMSADYDIALEEGATLVRIGSLIFGPRA
jgi:pyridoxal phosphate enzyme (YggS family)